MNKQRYRLGELLVAQKLISPEQLQDALEQQLERREPLGQILVSHGAITPEQLLLVIAMQKGVSAWHIGRDRVDPIISGMVQATVCRRYQVFPVAIRAGRLILAMQDTDDLEVLDLVRNLCKMRVEPALADARLLKVAIEEAYGQHGGVVDRLVADAIDEMGSDADSSNKQESARNEAESRPVVNLVNQILAAAVIAHASDIHVEPRAHGLDVRYRIDGELRVVHTIPKQLRAGVTARIKILSELDIVEYRVPQDGRMTITVDGRIIDMRVSVLPNHYGQRIVMRILDRAAALRSINELGFSRHNAKLFKDMVAKPHGIVLVTGPTGSGKTTTLYAALNFLKTTSTNIMTCEDPVEYDLDGINQSQVNEKVGLTFAAQLRAILRQDPDIVLVGEIRDSETADTAVRAALTGHLVLSTLHCNDAVGAIPRLVDMNIEPFLMSTALVGITAQRLIRTLCPACKREEKATADEQEIMFAHCGEQVTSLWKPVGCAECESMGYKGRAGVHEVLPVGGEMQSAIAAREPAHRLREIGSRHGYQSIQFDACQRAIRGETSMQEVKRLIVLDTYLASHQVSSTPAQSLRVA